MYFWKCWRESRWGFMALAVVGIAFGWVFAWLWSDALRGRSAITPDMLRKAWKEVIEPATILGGILAAMAGAALGASGVVEDYQRGSAPFLLSRPRPRWYFVWVSNAFGWLQIMAFSCLFVLTVCATLLYRYPEIGDWRLFVMLPVIGVSGLVVHGISRLLAVSSRKTSLVFLACLSLLVMYTALMFALKGFWHVTLPWPPSMFTQVLVPGGGAHLAAVISGWLVVVLASAAIEQLLVARWEV